MARMEIITGPERRRSWSAEQKRSIVAAAFAPEAIVADAARRAAVCAAQIYCWRQELGQAGGGFSQVVIAAMDDGGNGCGALDRAPAIDVEFGGAARVRIAAATPPELAAAVVRALRR